MWQSQLAGIICNRLVSLVKHIFEDENQEEFLERNGSSPSLFLKRVKKPLEILHAGVSGRLFQTSEEGHVFRGVFHMSHSGSYLLCQKVAFRLRLWRENSR